MFCKKRRRESSPVRATFSDWGEGENLACAVAIQPVAARLRMKGAPKPLLWSIVYFQLAIPAVCLFRACCG